MAETPNTPVDSGSGNEFLSQLLEGIKLGLGPIAASGVDVGTWLGQRIGEGKGLPSPDEVVNDVKTEILGPTAAFLLDAGIGLVGIVLLLAGVYLAAQEDAGIRSATNSIKSTVGAVAGVASAPVRAVQTVNRVRKSRKTQKENKTK